MKKKLVSYLSVFTLISSLFASSAFAQTDYHHVDKQDYKVIQKNKEITDLNVLYELAKQGRGELKTGTSGTVQLIRVDPNYSDETLPIKVFETSQLLQVAENNKGDRIETFAVTKLAIAASDSSKYDSDWDKTMGVKGYSTIYVDKVYDSRGYLHYKLVSAEGAWEISDTQYSLSNRKVTLGASGFSYFGSTVGQKKDFKPTSNDFNYSAPTTWLPISSGPIGATMKVTITRKNSGATWDFTFSNNFL
ncbi:hypothetical protein [Brevibacillus borstelensis]|uniref:hypothetical protein n=1 Tax=Brevibacillus borstelensis TaxID=45462 RepID=UPI0030C2F5DA